MTKGMGYCRSCERELLPQEKRTELPLGDLLCKTCIGRIHPGLREAFKRMSEHDRRWAIEVALDLAHYRRQADIRPRDVRELEGTVKDWKPDAEAA